MILIHFCRGRESYEYSALYNVALTIISSNFWSKISWEYFFYSFLEFLSYLLSNTGTFVRCVEKDWAKCSNICEKFMERKTKDLRKFRSNSMNYHEFLDTYAFISFWYWKMKIIHLPEKIMLTSNHSNFLLLWDS